MTKLRGAKILRVRHSQSRVIEAGELSKNTVLHLTIFSPFEFYTNNSATIAYLGAEKFLRGTQDDLAINVFARLAIDS